jgi:hypothetical protein
VARQAVSPLLRRPGQRATILTSDAGDVALGFAGERGAVVRDEESGVLLALDGELVVEGTEPNQRAAELLLRRYLEGQLSVGGTDGWFAAAVWDPRRGQLMLVADRMGHRPLYTASRGREVLVASELKALTAAGLEREIDLEAWAEMLAYEHALGDHAPLAGVRLVPPGTAMTISADGKRTVDEQWRYRIEPEEDGGDEERVDEFARLLEDAVSRRIGTKTALALSGGLDSRSIVAALGGRPLTAISYGAPGSEDLETGTRIARVAGLPHRRLPLTGGYIARGAAEAVWLAEGQVRCFHVHHLELAAIRRGGGPTAVLIGFSGDPIVRASSIPPIPEADRHLSPVFHASRATCITDTIAEKVLTASFAAEIRGLAQASLARSLADEEGSPGVRMRQHIVRHSHRRKVFPGSELFLDDLAPRDPFDDLAFLERCRRMPSAWREGGRLQKHYLRRFEAIAALPSPKEGVPPGLQGVRRAVARTGVRIRRRARASVEGAAGVRWLPDRHGLGDYARDLRGASSPLLDILLEPRTLARDQLREVAVRRLIRELRSGRERHTRVLGMLLTFELFQRQFVDGEGLQAPAAAEAVEVRG